MPRPGLRKEANASSCLEPEAALLPRSLLKKGLVKNAANKEFAATLDQLLISLRIRILEEHARCKDHAQCIDHARCIDQEDEEWNKAFNTSAPNASPFRGVSLPGNPPAASKEAAGSPPPDIEAKSLEQAVPKTEALVVRDTFHKIDKDKSGFIKLVELKRCFKAKPGLVIDEVLDEVLDAARVADANQDPRLSLEETIDLVEILAGKGVYFAPPDETALTHLGCKRPESSTPLIRPRKSKADRVTLSLDPRLSEKLHDERVKVSRLFLMQRLELELDLVNVSKQLLMFALYVLPFWFFILLVRQPVEIADAHRMLISHYGMHPTRLASIIEWSHVYTFMEAFAESNDLLKATGKAYWCDPRFLHELGLNDQGRAEYQRQAELQAQAADASHRRLGVLEHLRASHERPLEGRRLGSTSSSPTAETLEEKLLRLRLAYQNPTPLGTDAEGHDVNLYDCKSPTNYEMLSWYHDLQDVMRENTTTPVTDYGSRRRDSRRLLSLYLNSSNSTNYTYLASEVGPKPEYQYYYSQFREDYINYDVKTHEPEMQHHPDTDKFLPRYRYPYRQVSLLDPLVYQKRIAPLSCTGNTFADKYAHQVWNKDGPYGINAPKATDILDCFNREMLANDAVAPDIDTDGYEYKGDVVYARFAYQAGDHTGGEFEDWQRIGWLDKLTKDVTISALLYTQDIELFTMVTVQFEQGAGGSVHATIKLDSVVDFAHGKVNIMWALGIASAIFAAIACGQSFKSLRSRCRDMGHCSVRRFFLYRGMPVLLFEIFSRTAAIIFLVLYLVLWSSLPSIAVEYDEVLHTFLDLHDYSHSGMHTAIQHVFEVKEWIDTNAAFEQQMGFLCAIVFLIQSFQLVMYVSVHPRLGVLMSTMVKTINDIVHFLILFGTIFGLLGFFAHFTFAAASPDEFGTMVRALGKQFELIIGYGDDWPWRAFDNMDPLASVMFQMYVFMFVLLVFFIMINFFVAIVLQGFFDTKDQVEELVVEMSFWADMADVPITFFRFARAKWPKREDTIRMLKDSLNRDNLSPSDLVTHCRFPNAERALTFLQYYGAKIPVLLEEGL